MLHDVNITVTIDGKPCFAHGAVATPDPHAVMLTGLQAGLDHFRAQKAALSPQMTGASGKG